MTDATAKLIIENLVPLGTFATVVIGAVATGVNVVLGGLNRSDLKTVGKDAKAAKELTVVGNAEVADAKVALIAHADQLEEVRADVNSGTKRATDAAKAAADKSEDISVQLATLVAEKAAAIQAANVAMKAAELAEHGRDEALKLKSASDAEIADLRRKLADRGNGG